ncbi:MAG TPA: hypothetical protein VFR24_27545 [Candidatus Angelobacter sp.]|nr:hypothetical protein [Candidatus Angelobacter sp.]
MATLVDRTGNELEIPQLAVSETVPAFSLTAGQGHWRLAQLDCGLIIGEGDFTITLNLAAFDKGSIGYITTSCVGPLDKAKAWLFTIGSDPEASINEALRRVLTTWLVHNSGGNWRRKAVTD